MNGVVIENVYGGFTSTRLEGWTIIDQLKTHSKVDNSIECESNDSESSSSDTFKLVKKTADMTIWSIKQNTNDCSSSVAEPISRIEKSPNHRETCDKAEIKAPWEIQKECEQRTSTDSELSSSETLNLILKTEDTTIWSNKPHDNYSFWSTAEASTPYNQNGIGSRKRKPTARLDSYQLQVLKEIFAVCPYIVGRPRRELAKRLGLSENKIGGWFEYRRRLTKQALTGMKSDKEIHIPDYFSARL